MENFRRGVGRGTVRSVFWKAPSGDLNGNCFGETGVHRREVQEGPSGVDVGPGVGGKGSEGRRGLLERYSRTESGRWDSRREGVQNV